MARIDMLGVEEARNCSRTTLDNVVPTIPGVYKEDESGGPSGLGPEIWN